MKKLVPALLASTISLLANTAVADLAAVGLLDPINHFPSSITDTNNVALQLCLDGDPLLGICTFGPATDYPGNVWAATVGFGIEAFYNRAQAKLSMPNGRLGVLALSTEVSYLPAVPGDGNQFVFGRIRVRADVPGPGVYKIYHPYLTFPGCQPQTYTIGTGGKRVINDTFDVGGGAPFTSVLAAQTGPFLKWDPAVTPLAPAGYLGDARIAHQITGSKCGINIFRIDGPNIGGPGVNSVSTDLFTVTGKIATLQAAPLVIDRATYDRTGTTTRLNVFAQSAPTSTVTLSAITGLNPATALVTDAVGNPGVFFTQVSAATAPPTSVTVTATSPVVGAPSTVVTVPVTDEVDVIPAVYDNVAKTLLITARTSEKTVPPTLTAFVGKAPGVPMVRNAVTGDYTVTVTNLITPPVSVTVTSSLGGKDVEKIQD